MASKAMKVWWAGSSFGSVRVWRYQPMPEGRKAPPWPVGAVGLKGPAMAQSCGRVTGCQEESSKAGCCAPRVSDGMKRQPESKGWMVRREEEREDCAVARQEVRQRMRARGLRATGDLPR